MRWFAIVLVVVVAAVASAQVPRVLSYQGILTDSQGRILPDGAYQLTIRLYDRVDATEPIYVEEQRVEAVRGVVNVLIGTVEPLPWRLTFDRVYYVGISVNGSEELRPRTMLTAVPYALRSESAAVADVAKGLTPDALKGVTVQTTPRGPAGGDLTGTYPNPYIGNSKVTTLKIATAAVTTDKLAPGAVTAPKLNQMGAATGEYLRWNGSQWDPSPVSTDAWALTGNAISGTHFLGTTNAQPLVIRTSNTERLRITSSGNVGIGTTSPSNLLHIVGSSDPVRVQGLSTDNTIDNILVVDTNGVMKIRTATSLSGSLGWSLTGNGSTNPANNFLGTTDAVDLVVRTNNTERLRVSSSGFVGIGTSSPSATLDVNGSARMTGNLSVNGDATLGTSSSNQLTVNAQVASDLIPTTTNTYDLGITSLRWRNGWFAGTVTAGGLTLDGFTSGSVLFVGSGGALSENNATFFWDDVNMRLGIGTNAPTARLHVAGTGRFDGQLTVTTGGAAITGNSTVTGTLGVSSDVGVGGNLTVQGNTTLGDAPSDNVTFTARVNSNILPSADATYDLGSSSLRWKDGWFSGTVTSQNATVTSLMPGSVVFAGTGGALSQNNANFFWDNTNTRLGIGTNTPSAKLDVRPTASQRGVAIRAAASPTDNLLRIEDNSGNPRVRVDQNFDLFINNGSSDIGVWKNTGNVGIGTSTPAELLHVAGNTRIDGNTQLGDATTDNVTFTARVNSDILPSTDATYDLGSSTLRWKDGWFSGTVTSQNATVTSLTPGSVVFAGTGGALSQNNANFFWDNTNTRLGIGTNTPTAALDLRLEDNERGLVIRGGAAPTNNFFRIEENSGQYRWRIDQNYDLFVTDGSGNDLAVWRNNGYIGIGTTNPAVQLHLNDAGSNPVSLRLTNATAASGFDVGITTSGTAELRHQDDFPVEVYVNNTRALRIEPTSSTANQVPNIIGGDASNAVGAGNEGSVIGGGRGHSIDADNSVIAGGLNHAISGPSSGIVAGVANSIESESAFIGAGAENMIASTADFSAVVGGSQNGVSGSYAFIGSGSLNSASGAYSGILAGAENSASGDAAMAIGMGLSANSYREVVVGSYNTNYSASSETTWNASDRLFVVGNGQDSLTRSDALIIWKSGNAQFYYDVILGDGSSDNVTFTARVNSNIHPSADASYDLGSSSLRWNDGWFSGTVTSQNATVTSLMPGSVVFAGTGGALSQNNANLFWDDVNTRLGIGTNTPSTTLHVAGVATITSDAWVGGNLSVTGSATIGTGLTVSSGGATITGNTSTTGDLSAGGNLTINGNATLGDAGGDQVTINAATVSVPNIPSSLTATDVVVWNANNLERRAASGLISTYAWMLGGNAITNPATEWIGTSSAQPFVVRAGGTQTLQFNTNGSIQRDNGGNTRGTNAIDLQISRSSASQVASGSAAVIVGGTNNTASGVQSFVGAGDNNTASQQYAAVVAGISNSASGAQSFVGGGQSNQANGSYSTVAGGQGNVAQGQYSAIPGGFNMKVGDRSFGFSGQTSGTTTDLSGSSQIAAFVDVDLWLYNVRNQASQLRIYEPSGSGINYTAFQAQAQSSDITYTLPSTAGTAGQVLSIASVSGTDVTLQWSSALLHGTVAVDPPNISANTSATLTITINGVATGDRVFLTPPNDLEDALIFQGAAVTAPNTVTIKIRNVSGGTVDGGALDWNYLVIKP